MNKISINKCVGGAWDLTTKHWIMCIFLAVAMFIYSIINGFGSTDNAIGNPSNMTPEELNRMIASMLSNSLSIGTLIAYIAMYALQASTRWQSTAITTRRLGSLPITCRL